MNIICFHNPDEENGYLSNWYPSDFTVDEIKFTSMEQYMMYQKAMCFNDNSIAAQILETNDVAQIKALGRLVHNYNDHHWNGVRQVVIYEGLIAKLAECAVKDRIWGIGLSMTDPDRFDRTKWKGTNLLGYALMMVRDKITK